MTCAHPHLVFENGDNRIRCVDCPWVAENKTPAVASPTISTDPSRHSRWELPRDKPVDPCKPWCGKRRMLPYSQRMGATWCTKKCRDEYEKLMNPKKPKKL